MASQMLAYPGFGYPTDSGGWRIFISGVVWQTPVVFTKRQKMMIRMLGNVMKATPEDLECDLFQERITPFMAGADHRRRVEANISGDTIPLKKKTRRNGHFQNTIEVDNEAVSRSSVTDEHGNRTIPFSISLTDGEPATEAIVSGNICLLERQGISVISDIDDTVKISGVDNRRELLNNTFLRQYECVEGMVETYQSWSQLGASFHYVSSSPWQLFESLQSMQQDSGLPAGTMHLKNFRLREELLKKFMIKRKGKKSAIHALLKRCPDRDFILIGDSGEKDPEIYRKICMKHRGRIKGLFIRELPTRPMDEERMTRLRDAIGDGPCMTFSNGKDLAKLAGPLFESE